jgi:type II secretory pathway pseudopilin PulG
MVMRQKQQRRGGFTIIEMLVSTALIIFIMVVLTESFRKGMDAFRQLKTIGELQEKLRMATNILRKDLAADHFEGKKRLSDAGFWLNGPPREGFFRIWQGDPSTVEPNVPPSKLAGITDADGNSSFVATDHYLHFTVKRRGNKREEFVTAAIDTTIDPTTPLPFAGFPSDSRFQLPNALSSQWYEVAYFLKATGELTPGGTPRFNLYRRQRLLVANPLITYVDKNGQTTLVNINFDPTPPNNPGPVPAWVTPVAAARLGAYTEVCAMSNPDANFVNQVYFNSPADVTMPQRRFGMNPGALPAQYGGIPTEADGSYPILKDAGGNPTSADLLLADVVSFNVRVLASGQSDFADLQSIPNANSNPQFPGNGGVSVFDTWSSGKDDVYDYSTWSQGGIAGGVASQTTLPAQIQIQALQISIRVWDMKTRTTRQITIVQDM